MARRKNTSRAAFFQAVSLTCGECGASKIFSAQPAADPDHAGGALRMARTHHWWIEWRPAAFVRCPKCRSPAPAVNS